LTKSRGETTNPVGRFSDHFRFLLLDVFDVAETAVGDLNARRADHQDSLKCALIRERLLKSCSASVFREVEGNLQIRLRLIWTPEIKTVAKCDA